MEQTNTNTEASPPPVVVREVVRPSEGRIVAGVAQGIANRYDLPVLLLRIVFVALIFAGGLGLALYAAGWFLIRAEDEVETPAQRVFSGASGSRSWIGIGLIFIAALILLDNFTFLSGGMVWAVGLLVVGVLLYTGDLPRLVRNPDGTGDDDKEGVQQMTTTETPEAPSTDTAVASSLVTTTPSGTDSGGGPPPTPTPTPPVLPPAAPKPRETSYLGRITIGVLLVGLGILAILDNIPGIPIEPEPRHYVALALTILGVGLIVGGFVGRARWLIIPAAILIPTMLFSPAFEYEWTSENFDRTYSPDSFDELESGYTHEVGNLMLDLTDLPWSGEDVDLSVSVDAGNLEILLPPGVGLEGEANVDIGRVAAFGRESSGLGSPGLTFDSPGPRGTVTLDAEVDLGNIDIYVARR
ncbi:MAG TPA: PspC domain-containing protein [Acidimicrobiia bacterium]|nr:PspC domain-containing protein [Acidimicrobiia bacterium]